MKLKYSIAGKRSEAVKIWAKRFAILRTKPILIKRCPSCGNYFRTKTEWHIYCHP
jgi:uncharacterized OB-fold protein